MSAPPEGLAEALGWLRQGKAELAESKLRALLAAAPGEVQARTLLGVVLLERGLPGPALVEFDSLLGSGHASPGLFYNRGNAFSALGRPNEAIASFEEALALAPGMAEAAFNRGNCLKAAGRPAAAIDSFRQALAIRPTLFQAHNNIGSLQHAAGQLVEALSSFNAALALAPGHVQAIINRGLVLRELGRLADALSAFDLALRLDPASADAHNNRGLAAMEQGDDASALRSFDRALSLQPGHVDAWSNRGSVLIRLKRRDEAAGSCLRAMELDPGHAGACNNLGIALHESGRVAEALARFEQAISLQPSFAPAHNNLGNALHDLQRLDDALASFERAVQLQPAFPEAVANCGMVRQDLRQLDAARDDFSRALALRPGYGEALRRRASLELLQGNWREGWADYESAMENTPSTLLLPGVPRWRGEDLGGKSIVLSEPNGLGDTLQFMRFIPALVERGATVSLMAPRSMFRLLAPATPGVRFIEAGTSARFDFQSWLWSLPHLLGAQILSLADAVPYLAAEPLLVEAWKQRLGQGVFNIGINWQGNPARKIDVGRSIPLAAFEPLARLPGVRLVSLQKHHGLEQLQQLPAGMAVEVPAGLDEGKDAFVDSAALLASLDLLVTADSALGHLAGALGRPAWLALNPVPDWRWMLDRNDSPWYPSIRLFRQATRGHWRPVFEEMAASLGTQLQAART